jgi:hypothetical protein
MDCLNVRRTSRILHLTYVLCNGGDIRERRYALGHNDLSVLDAISKSSNTPGQEPNGHLQCSSCPS